MNWLQKLLQWASPSTGHPRALPPEAPSTDDSQATYPDQSARKRRSETLLRAEAVPINDWLPIIESESEITLRSPREAADRLSALVIVAFKAADQPEQSLVESIIAERGYRSFFTPDEIAFIDDPQPSERARIKFSWRCEAAWVLLWALRHVEGPLGLPRATCDVPFLSETVFRTEDLSTRGIRPAGDILDEADRIYRCHWAVRQAGLNGEQPPAGLDPGVTMERHQALNWLIGYNDGADWDDVTTDT